METLDTRELVALRLAEADDWEGDAAPYAASTPGIGEALGVGETVSGRIELLSVLNAMSEEGLLEERTGAVRDLEGDRNYYRLTDEGRRLVREVTDRIHGHTVTVENGDRTQVSATELTDYVPGSSLAGALARVSEEGVLYRREQPDAEFVDRESELATLESALEEAADGGFRGALLTGEPGVGKTTVIERLRERARARDLRVLTGTCRLDESEPYAAVRDALGDHLPDGEDPFERVQSSADDSREFRAGRTSVFFEVGRTIETIAEDGPVLVVLDDLQFASVPTRELVVHLLENRPDAPVLLLGSLRSQALPEDDPLESLLADDGPEDHDVDVLALDSFDRAVTRELIESTLGVRGVPDGFVDAVYDRTGGTPLFVKETLRQMLETGAVDPDTDYYPTDPESFPTPDSVETSIDDRLDALDDATMETLQFGSLIGDPIPFDVLAGVMDPPASDVREYLEVLVDTGLLARTPGGEAGFESDVVREAVRERLTDDERERIHERVAEYYSAREDADEHAVATARHFRDAGRVEDALEHFRTAGEDAKEVYAHEAAVEHYEAALECARELDREETVLELLREIGDVYRVQSDYEGAEKYYQYVLDRAEDPELRQYALAQLGTMRVRIDEYEDAMEYVERGLEIASDEPNRHVSNLLGTKAYSHMFRGNREAALEAYRRRLEVAEAIDDDEQLSAAESGIANIAFLDGDIEEAIERGRRSVEILEDGPARERAISQSNLGVTFLRSGELEAARECFADSLETYQEIGDRVLEVNELGNLALALQRLGEWDRARGYYDEQLDLSERLDRKQSVSFALGFGSVIAIERGHFDRARSDLERSLAVSREIEYARQMTMTRTLLARLAVLESDLDAATEHAEAAIDLAEGTEPERIASARIRLGDADRVRGDLAAATDRYLDALEAAETASSLRLRIRARCRLADVLFEQDRPDEATEHVEGVRDLADDSENLLSSVLVGTTEARRARHEERFDDAATALDEAEDLLADLSARVRRCRIDLERARLDRARDRPDAARRHAEAVRETAREIGSPTIEDAAEDVLASIDGH